jgi:glycosyltransferase involved in cell wall biosynthesis
MPRVAPITAVVITKNEGAGIERCLSALGFCDQVVVIDSNSLDDTAGIARAMGADVVNFEWNGRYPKKKQWGMEHSIVRNDWVLHLDADEIVTKRLAEEIIRVVTTNNADNPVAFDLPLRYHFMGTPLRFGHVVMKRSLVDRRHCRFPEVGDLRAPGITEVEGHYQPVCDGTVARLSSRLIHDDPDPIGSWVERHNKYADWEAHLRQNEGVRERVRTSRSTRGSLFDRVPFKPLAFFVYSYILRLGFLDGRSGFEYAYALSFYYWLIGAKTRELQAAPRQTSDWAGTR